MNQSSGPTDPRPSNPGPSNPGPADRSADDFGSDNFGLDDFGLDDSCHRVWVGEGTPVHLGISTCPNDTFAFAALLEGRVDTRGMRWQIDLLDIEQLNRRLLRGDFNVAKTSFHTALELAPQTVVLPVGAALGFGVGPLLLAARPETVPRDASQLTLCPGAHTTAALLFDFFYPQTTRVEQRLFSEIMPQLVEGAADFGVCIHEGRFTYARSGLSCIDDLGQRWEQATGSPLPLGGLVMRKSTAADQASRILRAIDDSLAAAHADRDAALPTMRQYAAELEDDVLMQHVDLYVNEWTTDLGGAGQAALKTWSDRAIATGRFNSASTLKVLDRSQL